MDYLHARFFADAQNAELGMIAMWRGMHRRELSKKGGRACLVEGAVTGWSRRRQTGTTACV